MPHTLQGDAPSASAGGSIPWLLFSLHLRLPRDADGSPWLRWLAPSPSTAPHAPTPSLLPCLHPAHGHNITSPDVGSKRSCSPAIYMWPIPLSPLMSPSQSPLPNPFPVPLLTMRPCKGAHSMLGNPPLSTPPPGWVGGRNPAPPGMLSARLSDSWGPSTTPFLATSSSEHAKSPLDRTRGMDTCLLVFPPLGGFSRQGHGQAGGGLTQASRACDCCLRGSRACPPCLAPHVLPHLASCVLPRYLLA